MTTEEEKELTSTINTILKNNNDFVIRYKDGQKGLIGFFLKKVVKESTISFYSKESKQKLVIALKNELINYELNS